MTLEEEARKLRDEAYGQVSTDGNWEPCASKWMAQIEWLRNITKPKALLSLLALLLIASSGCTVVSANRVFPKLTWAWSADAEAQRQEQSASKDWQADLQKAINNKTK